MSKGQVGLIAESWSPGSNRPLFASCGPFSGFFLHLWPQFRKMRSYEIQKALNCVSMLDSQSIKTTNSC